MKIKILLVIIFIIALFLRFYNVGTNPPALTWDEAAWGYNASTLFHTGRDEFGKFLPLAFIESFGDFKPPMYAYLSAIPVGLFGVSALSVRFVSAFFGSLTVLLAFFLTLQIFPTSKYKNYFGLSAALMLAISPWHILLSRAAFEANVATFFIILGITIFLYATKEKLKIFTFILSLISFVFAMYTFNTARIFLPIFVPFLFFLNRKILLSEYKKTLFALFPPVLISIPLLLFLITPQAKLRYLEVNIFSDIQIIKTANQQIANDKGSSLSKIIHNRRLAYGTEYIKHYLDNLDPGFLFIHGDGNPKFSIQDVGEMYIWELPFLIIGTFLLIRRREGNWAILPIWFILGIVPAATARETPHALRIETVLPVPQMLIAYGFVYSLKLVSNIRYLVLNIKISNIIYGFLGIFVLFNFLYFAHSYFVHYPITYASEWQYGYKDAVLYTESQKENYNTIYFTNALGRPYIYVLFYGNYAPYALQKNANITREALGFVHVNSLGKYKFLNELPADKRKALYVDIPEKVLNFAHIKKRFLLPNGNTALVAYDL